MQNRFDKQYLGDGVYVFHDEYQIWLTTGSHENEPLVALDEKTFENLLKYGQKKLEWET